jgi:hypothetical protein
VEAFKQQHQQHHEQFLSKGFVQNRKASSMRLTYQLGQPVVKAQSMKQENGSQLLSRIAIARQHCVEPQSESQSTVVVCFKEIRGGSKSK